MTENNDGPEKKEKFLKAVFEDEKSIRQAREEYGVAQSTASFWVREKELQEKLAKELNEKLKELQNHYEQLLCDTQNAHEKGLEELRSQIRDLTLYAEIGKFYMERKMVDIHLHHENTHA